MQLSPKAIKDFKQIYLNKRGIRLSDEQADQMGWKLLELANKTLAKTDEPP